MSVFRRAGLGVGSSFSGRGDFGMGFGMGFGKDFGMGFGMWLWNLTKKPPLFSGSVSFIIFSPSSGSILTHGFFAPFTNVVFWGALRFLLLSKSLIVEELPSFEFDAICMTILIPSLFNIVLKGF